MWNKPTMKRLDQIPRLYETGIHYRKISWSIYISFLEGATSTLPNMTVMISFSVFLYSIRTLSMLKGALSRSVS